jgi:bacillithiol biosynthesis cysteine-adding enzyme BshC
VAVDPALSVTEGGIVSSPSRVAFDLRRLPWIRPLAADYMFDFDRVAPFFAGRPTDPSAWSAAIQRARQSSRRRAELADLVRSQQAQRGAPAAALDAARRLGDPGTVAILTGQQAGLFGGPLFTLFKALTAIKLAEQVSRDHGVTAVAVFWTDAEDHDWNEVRSCTVLDETLAPRTVSLPARAAADHTPVAAVRLDASVDEALDALDRALPPTEFKAPLLADLREMYAPDRPMSDAFCRWMERVLGGRGLIVYDSSDPRTKPLVSGVFARELSRPGHTAALASRAGSELVARGYHAQVQAQDGALALFHLDGERLPIRQTDGGFLIRGEPVTEAALARAAAERPAVFSPNVLLRPIVQDTLFPTACYVAGPSELAYLGQLAPVYDHFGVPMPIIYPRASATIADAAGLRFLSRYAVPLEALHKQDESGLNELLQSQIPPRVEEAFAGASQAIDARMAGLIDVMPALDPTLAGAVKTTLGRMRQELDTLHSKMLQAAKRRDDTLRRQYNRTRAMVFPGGHAQERTIGFVSFLGRYGPALVDRLQHELPLVLGQHWVIAV